MKFWEMKMLKLLFFVRQMVFLFVLFISLVSLVFAQDPQSDYKKIVHTFNEAWNTGNYDLLDKAVHPKYFKQEGAHKLLELIRCRNM
jgi:hypothetical protein